MFTGGNIRKVHVAATIIALATSKAISEETRMHNINRKARWKLIKKVATIRRPAKCSSLSRINQNKRILWAEKYMKIDFCKAIFIEC